MTKKISALILALVLCLSVVVMPMSVNAAEIVLEEGQQIGFLLEWDQAYYHPGDTATLSVYMDAADDLSLQGGSLLIGLNSAVFSAAENPKEDLAANSTTAEWFNAYYIALDAGKVAWLADTVVPKVQAANTDEENALYDQYVKVTLGKNTAGWHENTGTTKAGFNGSDFVTDEPAFTITFKVRDDAEEETVAKAAITSGSKTCTPLQTAIKYYKNPGSATTTANIAATATSVEKAITNDAVAIRSALVNPLKGQIRFDTNADKSYASTFDVRALAVISEADFTTMLGSEANAAEKIKEVGFVFAAGSGVKAPSMDAVKALVENGTAADGYTKKSVGYLSTSLINGGYSFSCIVENIPDAEKTNSLVAVGYIKYLDAEGQAKYEYYTDAQSVSFETLYNAYYNSAFPA